MKIFVVDDDPMARMIAVDLLSELQFEAREFADGAALLAALDEMPDLILLDIEMPGMDGIAACQAFREARGSAAQVIFVSSHDDLDTRLAAYQAGASDFIVKPFESDELAHKLQAVERLYKRQLEFREQARSAYDTALTAMSSMGELGVVLQFLRASFTCRDLAQVAQALFDALRQSELCGLLEIRLPSGKQCFSSRGECTPLEESILCHASGMGRLFHFHDRLVINYSGITLLVLDLPVHDPDRIGRLRDHLATLAEGVEARVLALENEAQRGAQAEAILQAVAELTRTLNDIEQGEAGIRAQAMTINSEYLQALAQAFMGLGLTDAQETALARMAEDAYNRLGEIMDQGHFIGDRLRGVIERVRTLAACRAELPPAG